MGLTECVPCVGYGGSGGGRGGGAETGMGWAGRREGEGHPLLLTFVRLVFVTLAEFVDFTHYHTRICVF